MVSFHIEPTSKCTLECPLCDRTWFYETFKKRNLHEVNVNNIIKFVGPNAKITFDKFHIFQLHNHLHHLVVYQQHRKLRY